MITEVSISAIKAFDDQSFSLSNLNVLSGLNGTGKSTLIQCLLLCRQSFEDNNIDISKLVLNGPYVRIGRFEDLHAQYSSFSPSIQVEFSDGKFFLIGTPEQKGEDVLSILFKINFQFSDYALFNTSFWYLNAERIIPKLLYDTVSKTGINNNRFDNRGELILQYLDTHKEDPVVKDLWHERIIGTTQHLRLIDPTQPDIDDLFTHTEAWLGDISPGIKISTKIIEEAESLSLRYSFDTGPVNVSTNSFRPSNVGFGITYVLPVIIALLSAKRGDLIIIENPEAHLHPRGQHEIGKLIAKAASIGIQIVIETHSDHILNSIRIALKENILPCENLRVYFFTREEGVDNHFSNVESINFDQEGRSDTWPTSFFDQWEMAALKLL